MSPPGLPRTAWLDIDLDALTSNLRAIRGAVPPGTRVRPVVKADAYGHGMLPVARALVAAGIDGLCVATLDEALALRAGGVDVPVTVLYPVPPEAAAAAAAARIAVAAGDVSLLARTLATLDRRPGPVLAMELEVETGLGRGGFLPDAVVPAAVAIEANPRTSVAGLWTHLQDPADPASTAVQLRRFEAAADALRDAGVQLPGRHATASTGLIMGDITAYDGIRPGLAMYGLVPDELAPDALARGPLAHLRPVLALRARPVRVVGLPAGWGISYGPTFVTTRPSRIATLPLGYGDGWSRALSNCAEALVRGRRVPIVGNVAMDAIMVDVTDVPGDPVTTDDTFTLIGSDGAERITVADLAQVRNTNPWEVVATMVPRLPRVYHAASGPDGLRTLTEWS